MVSVLFIGDIHNPINIQTCIDKCTNMLKDLICFRHTRKLKDKQS